MKQADLYDVTIVGGGPAGLYSAFYSGLREMKTKLIEYQPNLGGKLHVYPEKMIWDVGGIAPISGADLIEQLVKQALIFEPTVVLNEKIVSISKLEDGSFLLRASSGNVHHSKTVIIAVGSGILNPKKLELEGAKRYEKTNLHYSIPSLNRFQGKTVLISGGGNAAIDWANELEPVAKKIYLTYRREHLTGHEAQVTKLRNRSITSLPRTTITKLIPSRDQNTIRSVELTDPLTGAITYIDVDDVVICHGYEQDTSLLKNSEIKIELVDDFYIAGNAKSETSVKGIFAAGDILHYDGKLHLIAGCFQDAANAVNQAKQYIDPSAEKCAVVSTHHNAFAK